jgi:hypothetical protein
MAIVLAKTERGRDKVAIKNNDFMNVFMIIFLVWVNK